VTHGEASPTLLLTVVDHIGYTVSDLDRSVEFYSFLLAREPTARKTWDVEYIGRIQGYPGMSVEAAFFELPGGLTLELVRYLRPEHQLVDMETYNVGNAHLALITTDLHRLFERLAERAEFRSDGPVLIEWGPYEGGYAARLRDPDGITIELIQLPPGGVRL
jgi:catechol 2,3-dioxygenase-like lactoylglutathione lyase family enzyme